VPGVVTGRQAPERRRPRVFTAEQRARIHRDITLRIVVGALGVIALVVFALLSPYFLTADNLENILGDIALAGVPAVAATYLLKSGFVDLSIGGTAAFAGIVMASIAPQTNIPVAVLLSVAAGLFIGLVNGLVVTVGRVDSIITTFASMALLRGLAYLIPSGLSVTVLGFRGLGNAQVLPGITLPVLVFLVVLAAAVLGSRSALGRRSREIGVLPTAERLAVARDRWWIVGLFVLSAAAATLSGLIRASQLGTGLPTAATGLEITVVTAALLGGARPSGARGSVLGTVLALAVLSIVDNGLSLANVTSYFSQVLHAALLVVALVVSRPGRGHWMHRTFRDQPPDLAEKEK
jgi:ribose transport system permease protein